MNARELVEQWRHHLGTQGDVRETVRLIREQVANADAERSVWVHAMRALGELVLDADRRAQFKELLATETEANDFGVVVHSSELQGLVDEVERLEATLSGRSEDAAIDSLSARRRRAETCKQKLEEEKKTLDERLETLKKQFAQG
jgi:hypothetical protein